MDTFKSLRQLTEELTGIRLGAADTSLWSIGATINERARSAINEALDQYPMTYEAMYYSATLAAGAPIVLPSNVKSVVSLKTWSQSNSPSVEVKDYRHVPSITTNLLYVHRLPRTTLSGYGAEMLVEIEIGELPANVALAQNCTTGAQAFVITGNVVDGVWPVQGYLEITAPPTVDTSQREVVKYDGVAPNAFTNIVRGIVGDPVAWDTAAIVSAVVPLSKGSLGVVEAAAQANMYRFWVGHRAQYDRYFALPGIQELDLPSLLTLIRSQEDAADRKYKRLHKAIPPVGTVRRKGRRR